MVCEDAELDGDRIKAKLRNESDRDVEEVVQVYAHAAEDADETPHAHLAAFKRVLVPPVRRSRSS